MDNATTQAEALATLQRAAGVPIDAGATAAGGFHPMPPTAGGGNAPPFSGAGGMPRYVDLPVLRIGRRHFKGRPHRHPTAVAAAR